MFYTIYCHGPQTNTGGFIPPHGGYAGLLAYRKALVVFQGTVCFCQRFLNRRDRTVDQMVQAARSGKQNIVEASQVSGTSTEGEIKLLNVARASLEELLEDYKDFLRARALKPLEKNSREALFVRKLGTKKRYVLWRPIGPKLRAVRHTWWRTFSSVSFTRRITSLTGCFAGSSANSLKKAACANA